VRFALGDYGGEINNMYTEQYFWRDYPPNENPFVFPWLKEKHEREIQKVQAAAREALRAKEAAAREALRAKEAAEQAAQEASKNGKPSGDGQCVACYGNGSVDYF